MRTVPLVMARTWGVSLWYVEYDAGEHTHGWGGSTSSRARAALKLQARVEMRTERLDVQLQEGCASERAVVVFL